MNIIGFELVNKRYGNNQIINDLSFTVPKGKIFGLLGPNGAGKTTLMRLMTRITLADNGSILFEEAPLNKNDVRRIGYMPEERGLYTSMKVFEQLVYIAKLYGLNIPEAKKDIEQWLTKLGMMAYADRPIGALSKGMSQKIQFIATVIHRPRLLVLDEPFSGLDPISSLAIEREIAELKDRGTSIILSTHRMDQVENFCDEVLLINRGSKVVQGTVMHLKNKFKEKVVSVIMERELPSHVTDNFKLLQSNDSHYFFKYENDEEKRKILADIMGCSIPLVAFNETFPRINDIFINLIKGNGQAHS